MSLGDLLPVSPNVDLFIAPPLRAVRTRSVTGEVGKSADGHEIILFGMLVAFFHAMSEAN